jgi:hypothetical protein
MPSAGRPGMLGVHHVTRALPPDKMVLIKTAAGQQALKDRQGGLGPRQRSAFILFDGKRSTADVQAATGISDEDVQSLVSLGLLESVTGGTGGTGGTGAAALTVASLGVGDRGLQERYSQAYPIATELTASLGLRGFRLNLAVEGSTSYADLAALAPKIRDAVGETKYARLESALFH